MKIDSASALIADARRYRSVLLWSETYVASYNSA